MASSGFLNPPQWDEKHKEFSLWLREVKAWKLATSGVAGLKNVHGLQLALHLPEGSEIRHQVFDTLETDELVGDEGWAKIIDLLEKHYKKDDNTTAFETWREFRNLTRSSDQTIDQYIMHYEKYKTKMKRFKMDLGERIHGLNLLCGAGLTDSELRIAMREVDNDIPDEMYEQAKKALKKYFGSSAISNDLASKVDSIALNPQVKQEVFYANDEEYNSFVAWRQSRSRFNQNSYDNRNRDNRKRFNNNSPKFNAKDDKGEHLKCHICQSIAHFSRSCPHRSNSKTGATESFIVSNEQSDIIECDIATDTRASHALNYMILDTGCPQNVAGLTWAECFIESLNEDMRLKVNRNTSNNKFKFGAGHVLKSLHQLEVPIIIAGQLTSLVFDVVDCDLPLLLGKQSMKSWNLVISTADDTVEITINNVTKKVELYTSSSGHWCVNIQPSFPVDAVSVLFTHLQDMTHAEKSKAAKHLHRQYCHPPFEFLKKVLQSFDECDAEFLSLLKKCTAECLVCKRYKPTIPRPAVGNLFDPDKMKFNEVVSLDLKYRNGRWILYMIDVVTRFTRAAYVEDKSKQTIVNKIIELWMPLFGAPQTFHMDNGGEFANEEMRELGNQFGIRIKHTPAYSPWSNGLNERNHATVDLMMSKMIEDTPHLPEHIALQYAVSVRNCCMYVHGFTPAQLALGQNPKLPSVLNSNLPALEGSTTSPIIAQHLNAIANARKAFAQAQISSKLRKALRHPIREYSDVVYQSGDKVFYKLPGEQRWQGEATVIGVDGKVVFVRHGSVVRRVHLCRLQLVSPVNGTQGILNQENTSSEPVSTPTTSLTDQDASGDLLNNLEDQEETRKTEHEDVTEPEAVKPENSVQQSSAMQKDTTTKVASVSVPKRHEVIEYKYLDDENWKKVTILGPAGSRRGVYKNWINVKDESKSWSMDWSDVDQWRKSDIEAVSSTEPSESTNEVQVNFAKPGVDDEFYQAKINELEKWKQYGVYAEVPDIGQKRISGRWVCTQKLINNVLTPKARYVIRGFQEDSVIQSDSPTGSKESMKILLCITASNQWEMQCIDIKSAFLQGKLLQRDVYIYPPVEALTDKKLWKLQKCIYGLNDAARMWYFAVWEELERHGCNRSSVDFGIFTWFYKGKLSGIMLSHVDDFLWAGTSMFEKSVISPLCKTFQVGTASTRSFKYVGIDIKQSEESIILEQSDYISSIKAIKVSRDRQTQKNELCGTDEKSSYCQLIGKLNWVACQTRPDIMFDVCMLSSSMKSPTVADIIKANKVLCRIKESNLNIRFPRLKNLEKCKILCYSDASLANLPSGKSTAGYVIFLVDEDGKACPLQWKSKTIRRVVRSTIAAETCALVDALDTAYFLAHILSEVLYSLSPSEYVKIPICAYTDNKSLHLNAHSTTMVEEKRLRIDIASIKQMLLQDKLVKLTWVPASNQLADCLTKNGADPLKLVRVLENGFIE